jgi:hypothetical protein
MTSMCEDTQALLKLVLQNWDRGSSAQSKLALALFVSSKIQYVITDKDLSVAKMTATIAPQYYQQTVIAATGGLNTPS